MNLQLLRGRDLRPPPRHDRVEPAAVPSTAVTTLPTANIEAPARKKALRFPVNTDTRAFYRRFYPDTTSADWNDWRWQTRNRIRSLEQLEAMLELSDEIARLRLELRQLRAQRAPQSGGDESPADERPPHY